MPVKRRLEKRRLDPHAEAKAWESYFDCGRDFFQDLPAVGVPVGPYGKTDFETARAAWHRLGRIFLANRKPDPHRPPWALQVFGDPHAH